MAGPTLEHRSAVLLLVLVLEPENNLNIHVKI